MLKTFAAIAAIAFAAPASAETVVVQSPAVPFERVGFADLDMSSPQGRSALTERIRGAATRVCRSSDVRPLAEQIAEKGCYHAALRDGLNQLNQIAGWANASAAAAAVVVSGRR